MTPRSGQCSFFLQCFFFLALYTTLEERQLPNWQMSLFWQLHLLGVLVELVLGTFCFLFFYDCFHIIHATVADFDGVFVENVF